MSTEENKAVVGRYLDAFGNRGDEAAMDQVVAPDCEFVGGLGGGSGPAVARRVREVLLGAFPDHHIAVEEMIAEGDRVVARMTSSGTHLGSFMGIAATGKSVSWAGVLFFQLRSGRIVRSWGLQDRLAALEQLGALPTLGPARV